VAAAWEKICDPENSVEPKMAGEQTAKLLQLAAESLGVSVER